MSSSIGCQSLLRFWLDSVEMMPKLISLQFLGGGSAKQGGGGEAGDEVLDHGDDSFGGWVQAACGSAWRPGLRGGGVRGSLQAGDVVAAARGCSSASAPYSSRSSAGVSAGDGPS